jgi:hypothetical protein
MRWTKLVAGLSVSALVAGCGTLSDGLLQVEKQLEIGQGGGNYPFAGPLIPDGTVRLSPNNSYSLEQLAFSAAGAALLYYIYDPLAPNWSIEEARLAEDTYRLSLKMKRYHNGGDGEAMMVMKRRATQLKYEKGYADYQILEYAEGIESSTPVARRFGEGVIRLVKASPQR